MCSDRRDEARCEKVEVWRIVPAEPNLLGQLFALWRHRFLFWYFAVHSLFSVHRGTILGSIPWLAISPLVLAIAAAFVVGEIFGVSTAVPLPVFILSGLAIWTLFRRSVLFITKSMLKCRAVLQLVYVPPLMLAITAIGPAVFQFAVVLALVVVVVAYYAFEGSFYVVLGLHTLAMIPAVCLTLLLAIAVGCFTSFLNVIARDTQLSLRYVLSGWMFATPIFYPIDAIPEQYQWIIYLNPMTSVVELFRWAVLGYGTVHWHFLGLATVDTLSLLILGLWFFTHQQSRLFDHL
jgi:lipopolysaccharide transport system permease protein